MLSPEHPIPFNSGTDSLPPMAHEPQWVGLQSDSALPASLGARV